jgi:hypothetical protein
MIRADVGPAVGFGVAGAEVAVAEGVEVVAIGAVVAVVAIGAVVAVVVGVAGQAVSPIASRPATAAETASP